MPGEQVVARPNHGDGTYAKGRDLDALSTLLAQWLEPRIGAPTTISNLSYPVGAGISNETILFDASWSDSAGEHVDALVLRVHPDRFQIFLEPDFDAQVTLLRTLGDQGRVAVPKVRWYEADRTLLGQPFFVMDRMHGRVPVSNPNYNATGWLHDATPAQRRHLWDGAMEQLCRIAEVSPEHLPFLHKPRWGKSGLAQQFAYWERSLAWSCPDGPPPVLVQALERLRSSFPADQRDGLSWGDARIGNMMFDENFDVLGVMDWEGASLGGPVQDLGWWLLIDDHYSREVGLPRLEGLGSRDETIDRWENRLQRKAEHLAWHEAFAAFKTSILSTRIVAAAIEAGIDIAAPKSDPDYPRLRELLGIEASRAGSA